MSIQNNKMTNKLADWFESIEPKGKMKWLGSTYEAFHTFAFTPKAVTRTGSHIRDAVDMKRSIIIVVIALIPALLFGMWNIGYQNSLATGNDWGWLHQWWFGFLRMLPLIVVSYFVGLAIEFAFAQYRHHEVNEGFLATGLLIPMIVPVTTPLWQLALAVAFAVIIGKEVFGGSGMNFLNPALVARAFLFFSYPTHMSGDKVWIAADLWGTDAIAGATPMGELATGTHPSASALDMLLGTIPGSIGETSFIAIALGAVLLLVTGIASWRIMLSVFVGGGLMGLLFNAIGGTVYLDLPFYYHFLMGGFAFGAVFMATDPVTAAQTNCGKWIYGFLIGAFAVLLRVANPAYPEGMMLSILFMNCMAPLIDHCVVSRNIKRRERRIAK
jgi:Na+-transporting NADH:ubiquinone oxidoreductase subunit B